MYLINEGIVYLDSDRLVLYDGESDRTLVQFSLTNVSFWMVGRVGIIWGLSAVVGAKKLLRCGDIIHDDWIDCHKSLFEYDIAGFDTFLSVRQGNTVSITKDGLLWDEIPGIHWSYPVDDCLVLDTRSRRCYTKDGTNFISLPNSIPIKYIVFINDGLVCTAERHMLNLWKEGKKIESIAGTFFRGITCRYRDLSLIAGNDTICVISPDGSWKTRPTPKTCYSLCSTNHGVYCGSNGKNYLTTDLESWSLVSDKGTQIKQIGDYVLLYYPDYMKRTQSWRIIQHPLWSYRNHDRLLPAYRRKARSVLLSCLRNRLSLVTFFQIMEK